MTVTVTCAHCGRRFRADLTGLAALVRAPKGDRRAGLEYRLPCPDCGRRTAVPVTGTGNKR